MLKSLLTIPLLFSSFVLQGAEINSQGQFSDYELSCKRPKQGPTGPTGPAGPAIATINGAAESISRQTIISTGIPVPILFNLFTGSGVAFDGSSVFTLPAGRYLVSFNLNGTLTQNDIPANGVAGFRLFLNDAPLPGVLTPNPAAPLPPLSVFSIGGTFLVDAVDASNTLVLFCDTLIPLDNVDPITLIVNLTTNITIVRVQ